MTSLYCSCGELCMVIEGGAKKRVGSVVMCKECMTKLARKAVPKPSDVPDFLKDFFGGLGKKN